MKIKRADNKPRKPLKVDERNLKIKQYSIKTAAAESLKRTTNQVDGGEEVTNAALTAYVLSQPMAKAGNAGVKFLSQKRRKEQAKQKQDKEKQNKRRERARTEERIETDKKGTHHYSTKKQERRKSSKQTDKEKKQSKKFGMKKLLYQARLALLMKQNPNKEGEQKTSALEMLLVQKLAIPALLFLGVGMLLVAAAAMPVLLVVAIIYNSPFAIFFPPLESGDTVTTVTSAYVAEFDREVFDLASAHTGYDIGEIVYVDYEGVLESPTNYYDILSVYMVKYGIGDTATVINSITRSWIITVVEDMCSYTTSGGTKSIQNEDGTTTEQSVLYVNVTLKDYRDMISEYSFSEDQVEILEDMMSPESLALLGYTQPPGNSQSTISQSEIDSILSNITDIRQKKVCSFALSKVGYPYSQTYRDSGDYYDCSSLAFYAWKYAGTNISHGGSNSAAAEAQGLDEAGKTVSYEELQPGDLIFYSLLQNGRYRNISHVAIYVGNGKVVEALNESAGVVYGEFTNACRIVLIGRP